MFLDGLLAALVVRGAQLHSDFLAKDVLDELGILHAGRSLVPLGFNADFPVWGYVDDDLFRGMLGHRSHSSFDAQGCADGFVPICWEFSGPKWPLKIGKGQLVRTRRMPSFRFVSEKRMFFLRASARTRSTV